MITSAELKKELSYNVKTGEFWWACKGRGRRMWRPAGRTTKGRYVTIGLFSNTYCAHHLAWFWMTGKWPVSEIDHKNTIRRDNRWSNLRLATTTQNRANTNLRKDNTSGLKGVSWHAQKNKWRARCWIGSKEKHLGLFNTKEAAHAVYAVAAKQEFGEFARP